MKLLIDTHVFLWFINDSDELSDLAKSLLESEFDLWLSLASVWEIAIKLSVKKLLLPEPFADFLTEQLAINEIELLTPTLKHFEVVSQLPLHHRDPFDRLIIGQAITEDVAIVSIDAAFDAYEVQRLW
jgi:PIN domain nuclease of toxin-antitoxin system